MMSVLEEPAIRQRVHSTSVETYHRLAELELIPERVELIRGAVIEKMPQPPLHASTVEILRDYLTPLLPAGWIVRQEKPLTLEDSEPEPDLAIVRGQRSDHLTEHPRVASLVIEVVVSSEALDRVKCEVYAETGVPECWLVLAEERAIERHTEPRDGSYVHVERAEFPGTIASTVFAGVMLPAR